MNELIGICTLKWVTSLVDSRPIEAPRVSDTNNSLIFDTQPGHMLIWLLITDNSANKLTVKHIS
jgi:hypothetical protein